MELPEEIVDDIIKRLHRVGGQVQALERMLNEGRDCRDIVTQFSAASKALDQAAFRLVAAGLKYCTANPEAAADEGYAISDFERLFLKLA